jgi:hypothetical protein
MQQATGAHLKALATDINTAGQYIHRLGAGDQTDPHVELGEILIQLAHMVNKCGEGCDSSPDKRLHITPLTRLLASDAFAQYPQTLEGLRAQIPEENVETAEAFSRASINLRKLAEALTEKE